MEFEGCCWFWHRFRENIPKERKSFKGEWQGMEPAGAWFPSPPPGVSLPWELQGTGPGGLGRLSSTCTTGNARLRENINIFCINREFEGKSKNLWEQRLQQCLSENPAHAKAEGQAHDTRNQDMKENVSVFNKNLDL